MNRHYDPHFKKDIVTIHPGEYFSTDEDVYIATVLGSCISIALFDMTINLGGLNHFMLPKSSRTEQIPSGDEGRFGNFAVELLINDMLKKGAKHENLRAKVFGGGNVLETGPNRMNQTGINNINFAIAYLETERIPILVNDTGGIFPRKIYFHPRTSKVYLKRIQKSGYSVNQIKQREEQYQAHLQQAKSSAGEITWF
ncbi:MAG: chemotaxis protein CheD [Treponemataceae bacterium]|nr:chemotaxis protein CheD [Treponemataceae bacterium]